MNKLDIRNIRFADFAYGFNKSRQRLLDVISVPDDQPIITT